MRILGAILAGGKSSRMGTDKGIVSFKGKPMIEHSISLLNKLTKHIVISTSNELYQKYKLPLVADEFKDIGPIGGIYSILKNFNADIFFILPCDVPEAPLELAIKLIEKAQYYDISIPLHNNQPEPLIGCYKKSILNIIEEQISNKDYKMQNLVRKCHTNYYHINKESDLTNSIIFKNINRPEDVE